MKEGDRAGERASQRWIEAARGSKRGDGDPRLCSARRLDGTCQRRERRPTHKNHPSENLRLLSALKPSHFKESNFSHRKMPLSDPGFLLVCRRQNAETNLHGRRREGRLRDPRALIGEGGIVRGKEVHGQALLALFSPVMDECVGDQLFRPSAKMRGTCRFPAFIPHQNR